MKRFLYLFIIFFFLFLIVLNREPDTKIKVTSKIKPEVIDIKDDCQEFIELHSISYLAKEYGQNEQYIIENVKIHLWENESITSKGKSVGTMLPGSRALIIQEGRMDYKVKSPYDNSVGWVNKMQVSHTLFQNINKFEPCEK